MSQQGWTLRNDKGVIWLIPDDLPSTNVVQRAYRWMQDMVTRMNPEQEVAYHVLGADTYNKLAVLFGLSLQPTTCCGRIEEPAELMTFITRCGEPQIRIVMVSRLVLSGLIDRLGLTGQVDRDGSVLCLVARPRLARRNKIDLARPVNPSQIVQIL